MRQNTNRPRTHEKQGNGRSARTVPRMFRGPPAGVGAGRTWPDTTERLPADPTGALTSCFDAWQVLGSNQRRLSRRFTDRCLAGRRSHPSQFSSRSSQSAGSRAGPSRARRRSPGRAGRPRTTPSRVGKRVGGNPSRVRIPYPPLPLTSTSTGRSTARTGMPVTVRLSCRRRHYGDAVAAGAALGGGCR